MRGPISSCIVRVIRAGGKCNVPYVQRLDTLCRSCSFAFGEIVHSSTSEAVRDTMPREAFGIVNMTSLVMIQLISVTSDMRSHILLLRRVVEDAEAVESTEVRSINILKKVAARKTSEFIEQLALSVGVENHQGDRGGNGRRGAVPSRHDSTGQWHTGFAKMLSKAVNRRSQPMFLRTTRTKDGEITEVEMRGCVASYGRCIPRAIQFRLRRTGCTSVIETLPETACTDDKKKNGRWGSRPGLMITRISWSSSHYSDGRG